MRERCGEGSGRRWPLGFLWMIRALRSPTVSLQNVYRPMLRLEALQATGASSTILNLLDGVCWRMMGLWMPFM